MSTKNAGRPSEKPRTKVIHIYKDFDVFNGLIAEFFVIAKYINQNLFDTTVCVFNYEGGNYGKKFQELGGKLHNLGFGYGVKGILNTVFRLSAFLREQKPDIVVTHDRRGNFFGITAARKAGVPIIISTETTLKDASPTRMKRLRDRLLHPFLTYLVSRTDAFLLNSHSVKEQWKAKSLARKAIVIHPPFNVDKYREAKGSHEQQQTRSSQFPTLGYLGRLSEEKGLHYLIGALAEVRQSFPAVKLLVGGTGEREHDFRRLALEKGLADHVTFLGFLENSFDLLQQIDLLVVPSRSEGYGLIAVEGLAAGLPVVATQVGGLKEILADGVGILVPSKDEKALAASIISILKNPLEMQKMGERGRKRAFELFTPMTFIEQLEGLYTRLMNERGTQRFVN
jgi:glycosyltransferase involved in cell wall biosynthesis